MTIAPPSTDLIHEQVRQALAEDIGTGDITANLIPESTQAKATVISREQAVLCGRDWFEQVFSQLDPAVQIQWQVADGDPLQPGQVLCTLIGPARSLLTGERTALNFLQTLSGTATRAASYVAAVAGTGVKVLDTRKTIPGLRMAQKYAVRCGGGYNHRIGLFDGILLKENHIASAGSIAKAVALARQQAPDGVSIEVEVETMQEVEEALDAGADILLLDNMSVTMLKDAVKLTNNRAKLEASGGISSGNIREIAETGVNYISVGDISKNLHAVDLSMRFTMQ